MEVPGMEEIKKMESDAHLTSVAAFVEGGVQDACGDACSICLEDFCDSEPSSVTSCKHEFHLQCILEWCQRSSQCPMCWQPISLKDPTSQELLEGVERERSFRFNPPRNATVFHHPTLGDFELQHLPVGSSDAELEERIIQHLAAAAAMGRARQIARREGHRNRGSSQGRPQYLLFSTHPNARSSSSPSPAQSGESEPVPSDSAAFPSHDNVGEESSQPLSFLASTHVEPTSASASGSNGVTPQGPSSSDGSPRQSSSPSSQDRPGPSDLQSISESLKSRFNAVSTRYKESISKSTRGWKERFFSRNTSMADLGSEVKREVNAGIASVSRMMERLETRDNSRNSDASVSNSIDDSVPASDNQQGPTSGDGTNSVSEARAKALCTPGSSSS